MRANRMVGFVGIGLTLALGAAVAVGSVLPRPYRVTRTARVDAPPEAVWEHIVDLRNHEAWDPWMHRDPTLRISYGATSRGPGAVYTWTSGASGTGRYTILQAEPPRTLDASVAVDGEATSHAFFRLEPDGGGTLVTWGAEGESTGVLGGYVSLLMEGIVGADLEAGLARLAAAAEGAPAPLPPVEPGLLRGRVELADDGNWIVLCGEDRDRPLIDRLGPAFAAWRSRAAEADVFVDVEIVGEPVDGAGVLAVELIGAEAIAGRDPCDPVAAASP